MTNLTLATRTGTEIVTRDLALGLSAAGHTPMVFCPDPGPIADEIRKAGVPVMTDLGHLNETPDVIHGHHHVETTTAMLRFPHTPAIFVCHDRLSTYDLPPESMQIRRYVAVDRNCLERLTEEAGLPPDRTRIIHNAVDLRRFPTASEPPPQLKRALIFSNYATKGTHLEAITDACSMLGLTLDVIGAGVDSSLADPERVLPNYDLVFAKARAALEAMAAGAAVVLCDANGLGPMVTMAQVASLRDWNFGARCLQQRLTAGAIAGEVLKYEAKDARAVSSWVREKASLDLAIQEYLRLYVEILEEARNYQIEVKLEDMLRKVTEQCTKLHSRLHAHGIAGTVPLPQVCIPQINLRPVERLRSMDAGARVHILVELENASKETLASRRPYPVVLAYHWIDPLSKQPVIFEGCRTPLTIDVQPRNIHRQLQLVEAPTTPGQYLLQLTIVQDLVYWFETVSPASATEMLVTVGGSREVIAASPTGSMTLDLQQAVRWMDGVTILRNGEFCTAGFVSNELPKMLTFVESHRFAKVLSSTQNVTCVLTTPEIAETLPENLGVAVCDDPRARFVDLHNHLAEKTDFYWRNFPTIVDPSARIHSSAQVPEFNAVVGPGCVVEANAMVGERVLIGENSVVQRGAILGAYGFQTDRSGEQLREIVHAGGIRIDAGVSVFAGALVARGLFREFTHIGSQARIGNRAILSHNVHIGTRAFVGHGAVLNGNVRVGHGAWVGPGSIVANNVLIGQDAHVGLGSTVVRNVPDRARVIGSIAVRSDRMFRFTAGLEQK